MSAKKLTPSNAVFYRVKRFHMLLRYLEGETTSVTSVALGRITWALGVVDVLDDIKNATLVMHG